MSRRRVILISTVVIALAGIATRCAFRSEADVGETVAIARGPIEIWSTYEGVLESRNVRNILSRLSGTTSIIDIAPEGSSVETGDLLVRFDSTVYDRDLLTAEREYTLTTSELEGLKQARLPLEIRDLELKLLQAQADLAAEEQFLEDSRELLAEGLIAEAEVAQQAKKVDSLRLQSGNVEQQLTLTRDYLHPAQIERAEAAARAAERTLAGLRQMVADCTMLSPGPGIVVYKPVHVGGEYRTIRVGDTIFRNQVIMALPDMTNLLVHIDVPESELALVGEGQRVVISPKAFPDLKLQGAVETVASIAQTRLDRPSWQKFFHATIALNETSDRLRSGMSVLCRILNEKKDDALLVPRRAVRWENEEPVCDVVRRGRIERRVLQLGKSDEQRFIVLAGIEEGERVALE